MPLSLTSRITTTHPRQGHIFRHGCSAEKKKLAKYVAVDRLLLQKAHRCVEAGEFLPFYEAVKHFQHTIQSRHFFILTDHMAIIFGFQQKKNFRHGILTY